MIIIIIMCEEEKRNKKKIYLQQRSSKKKKTSFIRWYDFKNEEEKQDPHHAGMRWRLLRQQGQKGCSASGTWPCSPPARDTAPRSSSAGSSSLTSAGRGRLPGEPGPPPRRRLPAALIWLATRERPRPILVRARGHTLVRAACRQGPQAGGRGSSGTAALGSLARSAARGRKNAAQGCPAAGSSPAGTTTGSCGRRASGTCSIRQPSNEHLTSRGRRLDCSGSGARTAAQGRSEVRATAWTDNYGGSGRALCPREEGLFHSIHLGQLEAAGNALMTTVREA